MDIRSSAFFVSPISAQSFSSELSQFDRGAAASKRPEANEQRNNIFDNLVNSTLDIIDIRNAGLLEDTLTQQLADARHLAQQNTTISEAERAQDIRLANGGAIDFFV